ncbi:hypothetical protein XI06_13465 [Bradyrhizobium sp. CCBAU 11434]|nr:hypothetical protein [Bradyrhizobium sp. CCBAU 11434]
MIAAIFAGSFQFVTYLNAKILEKLRLTDARMLQQAGRLNGPAGDNYLATAPSLTIFVLSLGYFARPARLFLN